MNATLLKSFQYSLLFHAMIGVMVVYSISKNYNIDEGSQSTQMIINLNSISMGSYRGQTTKSLRSNKEIVNQSVSVKKIETKAEVGASVETKGPRNDLGNASQDASVHNEGVASSGGGSGGVSGNFNENIQSYFEPLYPKSALRRGLQGTLKIKIFIGKDGIPLKSEILQSSGHSVLDNSAIDAVKKWMFKKNNISEFYVVKTIVFQLKG